MPEAPKPAGNDELIRKHYREVAEKHGASPRSSMEDDFVREKETAWVLSFLAAISTEDRPLSILDLGCGNGYTLAQLAAAHPGHSYTGLDFSEELLEIARARGLNCELRQGDARSLPFATETFDVVYTQRCLINILDAEEQTGALHEIARVLRPRGYYLMIECFTDGLELNNKARRECKLPDIREAYHNRYMDKHAFFSVVHDAFSVLDPAQFSPTLQTNFLSSHYFISRVLYPALTQGDVVRNSEIAKFFSFLPPIGNYSPIQAYILQKR